MCSRTSDWAKYSLSLQASLDTPNFGKFNFHAYQLYGTYKFVYKKGKFHVNLKVPLKYSILDSWDIMTYFLICQKRLNFTIILNIKFIKMLNMKRFLIFKCVINRLQKDNEQRYSYSYILERFKQLTKKEPILPSQKFHCTK